MSRRHTNVSTLYLQSAQLLKLCGRIFENELADDPLPIKREMIDEDIEAAIRDIADWAGFDLVRRGQKKEAA